MVFGGTHGRVVRMSLIGGNAHETMSGSLSTDLLTSAPEVLTHALRKGQNTLTLSCCQIGHVSLPLRLFPPTCSSGSSERRVDPFNTYNQRRTRRGLTQEMTMCIRIALPVLMASLLLCVRSLAEEKLRPAEKLHIEGVIRDVIVTSEQEQRVLSCAVFEGKTRLYDCRLGGGSNPPKVVYEDEVQHVSFTCRKNVGVFVSLKGGITVINSDTWQRSARHEGDNSNLACISDDGKAIFVANKDRGIVQMNIQNGEVEKIIGEDLTSCVTAIALSTDGTSLAIGCEDGQVASYDLKQNAMSTLSIGEAAGDPRSISTIITWKESDHVIWNREGRGLFQRRKVDEVSTLLCATGGGGAHSMTMLSELRAVAVANSHRALVISIENGKVLAECEGQGRISSLTAIGSKLIGGTWRGNILTWDLGKLQ